MALPDGVREVVEIPEEAPGFRTNVTHGRSMGGFAWEMKKGTLANGEPCLQVRFFTDSTILNHVFSREEFEVFAANGVDSLGGIMPVFGGTHLGLVPERIGGN